MFYKKKVDPCVLKYYFKICYKYNFGDLIFTRFIRHYIFETMRVTEKCFK